MPDFRVKPGTKSAYRQLQRPIADIAEFIEIVHSLILKNTLGCTPYYQRQKIHPPVERLREMYTAKFEYRNGTQKRIGTGIEMYDSAEGYETGIASVISNMANIASHRGKVRHDKKADLFSVMLRCHDPNHEMYYLNIGRNRITVSSYTDDAIRKKVEAWADSEPALA
jgi:hypothetical protein